MCQVKSLEKESKEHQSKKPAGKNAKHGHLEVSLHVHVHLYMYTYIRVLVHDWWQSVYVHVHVQSLTPFFCCCCCCCCCSTCLQEWFDQYEFLQFEVSVEHNRGQ